MNRFEGKRILITGATRGIGRAGALRMAAEGGEIIATGRDVAELDRLRQSLPSHATVLHNDAADPAAAEALAMQVAQIGPLDGLWLNAGFACVGEIDAVTSESFDHLMNANLKGPVLQMAALKQHLKSGASVVLTSSTSTYEGAAAASLYTAAKGALVAVARCWASALGPEQIRVNTLVPGPIDTGFRDFMPADFRADFETGVLSRLALPRIGTAEEAAAVAAFLLSDDAAFVTGSQYAVDGGLTMV